MANFAACPTGAHKLEPRRIRIRDHGGNNFYLITILQFRTQGCEIAVDARCHAAIADVGMYRIGKIDGSGSFGERENLPLRGKHKDLVGEQVHLGVFVEL